MTDAPQPQHTDRAADPERGRPRGRLRVYLGAAPGVGKTYAMLGEGQRRRQRGTDVVIGLIETHGRPRTAVMAEGLELLPRRTVEHRGTTLSELDVDAVLARRPDVVLVDELAHTNAPGSKHPKRWQDVDDILDAGIDVVTTVNIQHLESLNDVVEKITGIAQQETLPDAVVRAADQVELVDMTPEALRRRMAHGNVYPPDRVDAALANYFRVGNLTALRELALLWLADRVEEGLQRYRLAHDIAATWETRERVVVALTGGAEGPTLIRRAARIAARSTGGELLAVHVTSSEGLRTAVPREHLHDQRALVESLGGSFHEVVGDDVSAALLDFARGENATQLVLGASRRSRLAAVLGGPGIGARTVRDSEDIDVHIVTHEHVGSGPVLPRVGGGLTARRKAVGFALSLVLPVVATWLLLLVDQTVNLVSDSLVFLLLVVVVAVVGGALPALVSAIVTSLLLNYFFIPPVHTFTIGERNNALAVGVFLVVAALVSSAVDLAARRTREATRSAAESRVLADLTAAFARSPYAIDPLLERIRTTFGLRSMALLIRRPVEPSSWSVVTSVGDQPASTPQEADVEVPVDERRALVGCGHALPAADRRVLTVLAAHVAVALAQRQLAEEAERARPLEEADKMRTALLAAVGHDFRTPLASAKAAVSSLAATDVTWTDDERAELLATADISLDRLRALVDNLLDMSRLQAGAMSMQLAPIALDELVPVALDELGEPARAVVVDVPDDLPPVRADAALLTRVVVNLTGNALRHSPEGSSVRLSASTYAGRVELRVVDRGPGIPIADRERVFAPFQRLGDTDTSVGVGLGLALSRGLVEAMSGTLQPEDTPGGGLTMVVALPVDCGEEGEG